MYGFQLKISESERVLLKKNASETERAGSFDEVKRSEVERQAAVSSPGKLTAVFRSGTPNDNRWGNRPCLFRTVLVANQPPGN